MYYANLNYDFGFFPFSPWPTAAILFWKNLRLNSKIDITNEFYTLKITILHVLHKSELWFWNFQIFKMAGHRHLDFWKSLHGDKLETRDKTRDNLNFYSGHIQVAFLIFSAFYLFFIIENTIECSCTIKVSSETLRETHQYCIDEFRLVIFLWV